VRDARRLYTWRTTRGASRRNLRARVAYTRVVQRVAALYIDPRGPYPCIEGVDCWDETRDARTYDGPDPIVAHPPCGPWGRLRHLYRGAEHDCGPRAVEQIRKFGGVLEHPAGSLLWGGPRCGKALDTAPTPWLPMPPDRPDAWGGYTIIVDQCEWGHPARKRTWLYLVGVPRDALEAPPFPGREPTHWVSGRREGQKGAAEFRSSGRGGVAPAGIKICSAQQRRRTPPLFAEYLVRLARAAARTSRALCSECEGVFACVCGGV